MVCYTISIYLFFLDSSQDELQVFPQDFTKEINKEFVDSSLKNLPKKPMNQPGTSKTPNSSHKNGIYPESIFFCGPLNMNI